MTSEAGTNTAVSAKQPYRYLKPFRGLYEKMGVNFDQMLEIIELKSQLLIRTEIAQKRQSKKQKETDLETQALNKHASLFSPMRAFSYMLTSLFIMLYGFLLESPSTGLSLIFSVCFVMQFLSVITSFPILILDTKDITILTTKPLSTKTIAAAKTTLATLYLCFTSGTIYSFTFIPFIYKGYYNVLPPMLLSVVLSNLVCVALAYLLYGLVLKFYDGEKLKDIISGFQIVMTVGVMLGYQVIAQIQNIINTAAEVHFEWWHVLIVPFWFANVSSLFLSPDSVVPALISFGLIVMVIVIHFTLTGKMLEENLNKMMRDGETKRSGYNRKLALQTHLASLIYKESLEKAFFLLSYSISVNDRKMKQTIYPLYVSMIILPAIMILNAWRDQHLPIRQLFAHVPWLVFTLYFTGLTIGSVVIYVKRTEKPQGKWLFDTLPIASKRRAFKAAALNIVLRYIAVPMLLFCSLFLYWAGFKHLIDLILIFGFTLLTTVFNLKSEQVDWPFSYELSYAEGKRGMLILINLAGGLLFVVLHVLLAYFLAPIGVIVLTLATYLATYLIWRRI